MGWPQCPSLQGGVSNLKPRSLDLLTEEARLRWANKVAATR